MVDPLQLALAPLATKVVSQAIDAVLGTADAGSRMLEIDGTITLLDDERDEPVGIVTHAQMVDIEAFLEAPEVASIFQSWAVLNVFALNNEAYNPLLDRLGDAFSDLARQWCDGGSGAWESYIEILWRLSTNTIKESTVSLQNITFATQDDTRIFDRTTTSAQLLNGKRLPTPFFIRRILDVVGSIERTVAARRVVLDICSSSRERFGELQLNHVQEDYRFEVDQLYVNRTLAFRGTGKEYPTESVLSGQMRRSRVVVIGDPGVGKSTLVRHVIHKIASREKCHFAPVLIEARGYAGNAWGTRLTEYVAKQFDTKHSIQITEDTLIDILSIGSAYIVVDGVDEITEIPRRRDFIRQIESFARSFPLVPILTTSRKIGYERANFHIEMFNVFELREFTDDQFTEYVTNWFTQTKRELIERDSFIRESEAVADIRNNPLMLSLLCTLHRARGYIPRNRRLVYRECAELLFQRWDSMRHVDQPYDHRQYGERLMQELARFFYHSQHAQAGLEEGQLERVVAAFFEDTASVEPPENKTRARQFLDFCADRAWLLTVKGSNARGVRLFGFTHRTFMEYLAAEALVRNARDLQDITDEIVRIFEADPSSVLPDVLVQCVDDKFERGAETIFRSLLARGKRTASYRDRYLSLCLRIVNSSPMSRAISAPLPGEIQWYWTKTAHVDETIQSSRALFELYRDPRNRILRAMTEDSSQHAALVNLDFDRDEFVVSICGRWARFCMRDEAHHFEDDWIGGLEEHFESFGNTVASSVQELRFLDIILIDYLVDRGQFTVDSIMTSDQIIPQLYVTPFGLPRPGSLIRAVFRFMMTSSPTEHDRALLLWFSRQLPICMIESDGSTLAEVLSEVSRRLLTLSSKDIAQFAKDSPHIVDILLWLSFVTYEAKDSTLNSFHVTVDGVVGMERFQLLLEARDRRVGVDLDGVEKPIWKRPLLNKKIRIKLEEIRAPGWVVEWIYGSLNLLGPRSEEIDSSSNP